MTSRPIFALSALAAFTLTGCMQPYYGNTGTGQPSNTQTGAFAGALIGGAAGAAVGGGSRVGNIATGALVGGAIGGLVGNRLDQQAAELQSEIGGNGTTVTNTGSSLVVRMPQDVLFATDSATVQPALTNDLYAFADNLNRYPDTKIEVVGHTDNTGSAAHNADLSQRRAAAVADVLRNSGVAPGRIVYFGRGEDQPIASNLTPEGRAQNRRVEITIRPAQ